MILMTTQSSQRRETDIYKVNSELKNSTKHSSAKFKNGAH